MALDDSGTAYVLDARSGRIGRWTPDGAALAALGGLGNGLGEFRAPSVLRIVGDSLLVWDRVQQRLTVLSLEGDTLGFRELEVWAPRDGYVRAFSVLAKSTRLAVERPAAGSGTLEVPIAIAHADSAGVVSHLAEGESRTVVVQFDSPQATVALRRPFGHRSFSLPLADSGFVLLTTQSDSIRYTGAAPHFIRGALNLGLPDEVENDRARAYRDSSVSALRRTAGDSTRIDPSGSFPLTAIAAFIDTVSLPERLPYFSFAALDERDQLVIEKRDGASSSVWLRYDLRSADPPDTLMRGKLLSIIDGSDRDGRLALIVVERTGHVFLRTYRHD